MKKFPQGIHPSPMFIFMKPHILVVALTVFSYTAHSQLDAAKIIELGRKNQEHYKEIDTSLKSLGFFPTYAFLKIYPPLNSMPTKMFYEHSTTGMKIKFELVSGTNTYSLNVITDQFQDYQKWLADMTTMPTWKQRMQLVTTDQFASEAPWSNDVHISVDVDVNIIDGRTSEMTAKSPTMFLFEFSP